MKIYFRDKGLEEHMKYASNNGWGEKVGSDLSLILFYTMAFSHGPTTVKSTFSTQKYYCIH